MINYPDGPIDSKESDSTSATPFPNLRAAGRELPTKLESDRDQENAVVVAVILGGVPVGHEVANRLGLPFDFVIFRRLLAPDGPGDPVCAVNVAGNLEIVGNLPPSVEVPVTGPDFFIADALATLQQRERCAGASAHR